MVLSCTYYIMLSLRASIWNFGTYRICLKPFLCSYLVIEAKGFIFGLSLYLTQHFVRESSEGAGETARQSHQSLSCSLKQKVPKSHMLADTHSPGSCVKQ